jgi:ubiquinone/menaquinone biosynthesis C-methylase UbiE
MRSIRDPEGFEVKNLLIAAEFSGRQVLEIGCGTGWLTRQYAGSARHVIGIDSGFQDLQEARADQPVSMAHGYYAQSVGENLPFPSGSFDLALYSNSL